MNFPKITEVLIRQHTSSQTYQRAEDYFHSGAVLSLQLRGNVLSGQVEGSQYYPYQVQVLLDQGGVVEAVCDCPYDWGGWCKHIAATLLACIHHGEVIEEKPELEEMLTGLDRDELEAVLLGLVERNPDLLDWIEDQIQVQKARPESNTEGAPRKRRTGLDLNSFRRQVSGLLHSLDRMRRSEAYWHVGEVVAQIGRLIDQAQSFVNAGDGRNALLILEAITEEYVEGWVYLDDSSGAASDLFSDLGQMWMEAILSADLNSTESQYWADRLSDWQRELEDYGVDEAFDAPQAAALMGWDYPPLQRVLKGEDTALGPWEGELIWYATELTNAMLNVLERQGRYEAYLRLAKAQGQTERCVEMLVSLGRIEEALAYGKKYISTTSEALVLASALREKGEIEAALPVAEWGLTLSGHKYPLATWLRDVAIAADRDALALEAGLQAVREIPSLEDYLAVAELAGESWPRVRAELLSSLGVSYSAIDIFLHEGLVERAIQAIDRGGKSSYDILERVVDAAVEGHPDWAIKHSLTQAEEIMDAGRSDLYHHAVKWLEKARRAYQSADRGEEWREYLSGLIEQHARKYKLRPMLEAM